LFQIIQLCGFSLSECDYTIISNIDLKLAEDFFAELCCLDIDREIGCIAPCIFSESQQKDRNPKILSRPGRKKLILQRTLYQFPILDYIYTHIFYLRRRQKIQNYPAGDIYAAHGSFIIFTNSFTEFLQTMEYPCFLFGEEIYLAENLQKLGLRTYYEPKLKVFDFEHVSTGKMRKKAYYLYNYTSIDMLLKEYFKKLPEYLLIPMKAVKGNLYNYLELLKTIVKGHSLW